jgi:hypothetical protein
VTEFMAAIDNLVVVIARPAIYSGSLAPAPSLGVAVGLFFGDFSRLVLGSVPTEFECVASDKGDDVPSRTRHHPGLAVLGAAWCIVGSRLAVASIALPKSEPVTGVETWPAAVGSELS